MRFSAHPYASFLHLVRTPARYIGGEFGSCIKEHAKCSGTMVLVFPDVYEVGTSHLGSQILYEIIAKEEDLCLERCYAPWPDMEAEIRRRGLPLVSLETYTPLRLFDIVGFSLTHELSYTNVLNVLDLARITLRSVDRSQDEPIIIAGGPCAVRPAPLFPFIDAFFVGEAENALANIIRKVGIQKKAGASRAKILQMLAEMPGMLVPAFLDSVRDESTGFIVPISNRRIERQISPDLDVIPVPFAAPMPWARAVFDRASVEIARGCSEGCRFCEAGYTYRPLRERSSNVIINQVLLGVMKTGLDEVSLCALSPADCPTLGPVASMLADSLSDVALSVSSLRAYGIPEDVLRSIRKLRATGLTLAPEAGTQRLRNVINKNVTNEDLLEAATNAFSSGWQRLKLYFMIGLPTETDEDVKAIADLVQALVKVGRTYTRKAEVTVSVGIFVPRPHTPFQWEKMEDDAILERRVNLLRSELRLGAVTVKVAEPWLSRLECAMARGDLKVANVIEAAFRLGCRFDSWDEMVRRDLWMRAFSRCSISLEQYTRAIPLEATLPWDLVDVHIDKKFLLGERERAMRGVPLRPCSKPPIRKTEKGFLRPTAEDFLHSKKAVCYKCGVGCNPNMVAERRANLVREASERWSNPQLKMGHQDGTLTYWLLVYTKLGRAAWLGQRDIINHLPRILRRAGLKLVLSKGFHPVPRITYRPPMPLGYQSIGEWAIVTLEGSATPEVTSLNAQSIDGLEFLRAQKLSSRRALPGVDFYIFRSDKGAAQIAETPFAVADVHILEPRIRDALRPEMGDCFVCVRWPTEDRPQIHLHRLVSSLTGKEYTPFDFVRLFDCPDVEHAREGS